VLGQDPISNEGMRDHGGRIVGKIDALVRAEVEKRA
jgi:hypothetical protein